MHSLFQSFFFLLENKGVLYSTFKPPTALGHKSDKRLLLSFFLLFFFSSYPVCTLQMSSCLISQRNARGSLAFSISLAAVEKRPVHQANYSTPEQVVAKVTLHLVSTSDARCNHH